MQVFEFYVKTEIHPGTSLIFKILKNKGAIIISNLFNPPGENSRQLRLVTLE